MSLELLIDGLHFLEKTSGPVGKILKGFSEAGKELTERGHPILGAVARYTPAVATLSAAHGIYTNPHVQNAIYRYQMWKYNRDMLRAQQGGMM